MKALINSMTDNEQALVRETERERLEDLGEDDLLEVHDRVRRARNKHVKQYRRAAASRVEEVGGRGAARPGNTRNAQKAEVFEDALARVSRYVAKAARRSAADLKAERLRNARAGRDPGPARAVPEDTAGRRMRSQTHDRAPSQPVLPKQRASSKAMGARRQARRDSR
ncbi:hypothetical protein ACFPZN_06400 [Actinomadura rugatobispora]|uniref:Uncharacterized protein n=2 Tax=Actinomadura rugatobispora TaxID=1994 RepID=A0ABW0ZRH0_9ACTN|nr:hypothetical protein GCM10010200_002940 [Actinomadura rugatobispora]